MTHTTPPDIIERFETEWNHLVAYLYDRGIRITEFKVNPREMIEDPDCLTLWRSCTFRSCGLKIDVRCGVDLPLGGYSFNAERSLSKKGE